MCCWSCWIILFQEVLSPCPQCFTHWYMIQAMALISDIPESLAMAFQKPSKKSVKDETVATTRPTRDATQRSRVEKQSFQRKYLFSLDTATSYFNKTVSSRITKGAPSWVMHKYALCLFTSGGALFNQANVRCIAHAGYFDTLRRYKKTIKIWGKRPWSFPSTAYCCLFFTCLLRKTTRHRLVQSV